MCHTLLTTLDDKLKNALLNHHLWINCLYIAMSDIFNNQGMNKLISLLHKGVIYIKKNPKFSNYDFFDVKYMLQYSDDYSI